MSDIVFTLCKIMGLQCLFYVEQSEPLWEWRYEGEKGKMVTGESDQRCVCFDGGMSVLECRKVGDEAWGKATLREFGEARCRFMVKAKQGVSGFSGRVDLTAVVRGGVCVYAVEFPEREWIEGDELELEGVLVGGGQYGPLFKAGEFQCVDSRFEVSNVSASVGHFIDPASSENRAVDLSMRYMAFHKVEKSEGDE